ncbi:hypothetical protein L1049_025982 [Liquidambar formosana]|uniref:Uncharacterized protein n=1 Tax=Liquidambar formosana TaxID=63359 RepID=A0AAP0R730_LIQFO
MCLEVMFMCWVTTVITATTPMFGDPFLLKTLSEDLSHVILDLQMIDSMTIGSDEAEVVETLYKWGCFLKGCTINMDGVCCSCAFLSKILIYQLAMLIRSIIINLVIHVYPYAFKRSSGE